ncbi:carbohydrate ABC transporter permease [Blautia marasmi]|uniref:carbohydrate ABC transporter permease n=1 Tax=Blautia marasmi TaxID=1917868 RepID=UPI000CF1F6C3|nr:carbohydrate ABC transporter permease [Blautia marasmi]
MHISKNERVYQILANIFLILLVIVIILPFLLLFLSSITKEGTLVRDGYTLFPKELSLEAYRYIFVNSNKIFRAYAITIGVTIVGTALHVFLSSMLAYPLSLKKLPGRSFFSFFVFFTMLFNGGLVPTYMMYTGTFHIKNTIIAMIVPGFLMSAVNVLLIRTYFSNNIPEALFEAAEVDGAGHFTVFTRIVLPLGKPILVTVGLFAGLGYWNDWTNGLYYISDPDLWGIQNLLNKMISDIQFLQSGNSTITTAMSMGPLPSTSVRMAIAFIAMVPILILYPFLQKYFAKGIAMGAVKG